MSLFVRYFGSISRFEQFVQPCQRPLSVVLGLFLPRGPKITFVRGFNIRFVLELLLVLHLKTIKFKLHSIGDRNILLKIRKNYKIQS